ncbi:MAG: hypothetical protein KDE19_13400, partial [Caldilineaceae bacterium]|nr:hypothetical protein [Caldilineaceae bacterium]
MQYKTCCRLLAEELGVEPMAETTALYQQIQAGELREANVIPKAAVVVSPSELSAAPRRAIGLQPSTPHSPTPTAVPNNLFATLSAFIGRQTELAHLAELLTVKKCRLLTIFGPGGVGKSSLALALGQRLLRTAPASFPDGIFFVPLSGVEIDPSTAEQDPDNRIDGYPILTAIAEAIGYRFQGGRPVQAQLIDYLQHRRLLLVLDNFEQLVTCANILVNVLTHTQATSILVTSRIRLNIRGETTVILKGLSLVSTTDSSSIDGLPIAPAHAPNTAEQTSDAVALFVDRAKNLNPNFTVDADTLNPIIRICQTVIGLPLAIEMTAAWTTLYSCAEIAERLTQEDQQVNLLTSQFQDQPARQQNLQKVFEDSWALLPTQVQWALAKVGVFSGQFTSAAALAIADLTPANLLLLRDHSMMQVDDEHHCSLHPLMRQFAAQKWQELTAQQPDAREHLRNVHSNYYLQLLADLVEHHSGKAEFVAIHSLKKAHAEIVRSWQWAMQHHGWTLISNSMVGLLRYLELTNQSIDGKALFGMAEITENDPVAQWLQVAQCHFCRRLTEFDEARDRLMAILAILPPTTVEEEMANAPLPTDAVGKLALRTRTFALCVLGWI